MTDRRFYLLLAMIVLVSAFPRVWRLESRCIDNDETITRFDICGMTWSSGPGGHTFAGEYQSLHSYHVPSLSDEARACRQNESASAVLFLPPGNVGAGLRQYSDSQFGFILFDRDIIGPGIGDLGRAAPRQTGGPSCLGVSGCLSIPYIFLPVHEALRACRADCHNWDALLRQGSPERGESVDRFARPVERGGRVHALLLRPAIGFSGLLRASI